MKSTVARLNGMAAALLFLTGTAVAQRVIHLYNGPAPGSENWNQQEKQYFSKLWNTQVVTNVTEPTLIVYAPEPSAANGTAIVICPGGGFHALSINGEGIDVAKWLNARGVTAFVLKYRLMLTGEDGTMEFMQKTAHPEKLAEVNTTVIPMAIADATAAVAYVRKHAGEFGVAPDRIGLMGFSAGGHLSAAVTFSHTADTRPDFAASIYPYLGALKSSAAPAEAPPMFIAAASDDQLGLAPDSINLYEKWLAAKKPVELHMYSKGGHGFGMRTQNFPSDHWIDRFGDWLQLQGLLGKTKR
jgi:acetyl esterase/lipase